MKTPARSRRLPVLQARSGITLEGNYLDLGFTHGFSIKTKVMIRHFEENLLILEKMEGHNGLLTGLITIGCIDYEID